MLFGPAAGARWGHTFRPGGWGSVGAYSSARRLELGSAVVNNIVISFAESPTFGALGLSDRPALILGMSELRLFRRVAIDFRSSRVLFDLPRGAELENMFRTDGRATRIQ